MTDVYHSCYDRYHYRDDTVIMPLTIGFLAI